MHKARHCGPMKPGALNPLIVLDRTLPGREKGATPTFVAPCHGKQAIFTRCGSWFK